MKRSLVIVQDVPTQFDVPLYNQIGGDASFKLSVIYTQMETEDIEIGRMPHWDHIKEHKYKHHFLNDVERRSEKRLMQSVLENNPDHVIISGYWPKLHRNLMYCLKKRNISVGLRSDNTVQHSKLDGLRGWVKRLYLKKLLSKYNAWHPVGNQAANYLELLSGIQRPIRLFPYNVDNQWFLSNAKKSRKERNRHLAEIGFPEDSYIVLGVMKWAEREDPLTLIDAFKRYQSINTNARLILVGDGPLRPEVEKISRRLRSVIHTPGYAKYSHLPFWFGLADVFVHPAQSEPWGVSVNEALASGVPVIASSGVGAATEMIEEGYQGGVFNKGDVMSLVKALEDWHAIAKRLSLQELNRRCQDSLVDWNYESTIQTFNTLLKND